MTHKQGFLTPRQIEAVNLLASGCGQKEIADRMGCSIKWVGHLFDHAYNRTGARGRVALVVWAIRNGAIRI